MNRPIDAKAPSTTRPLREGASKPHGAFHTRLQSSLHPFITFLDYGCSACYISKSLAKKLNPYQTRQPSKLSGIGGTNDQSIARDVIIRFSFKLQSGWSLPYDISCGVVDDDTFPGDLTIGESGFYKMQLGFNSDDTVRLGGHPNRPSIKKSLYPSQ